MAMFLSGNQNLDLEHLLVSEQNDIREGYTAVVEKKQALSGGVLSAEDLDPPSGIHGGLVSVDVQCDSGVATIRWTFRAEYNSQKGSSQGVRTSDEEKEVYELDGSVSQEPITSHPKYPKLLAKYASGESGGEPQWYEKDPDNASSSSGLSGSGNTITSVSPLYGVRDFLMANAVYRRTKYYERRSEVPSGLVDRIGKIDEPSGLSESSPKGRFLKIGVEMRQMGDAFQVTEQWMASQSDRPEGLWKSELYG